MGFSHLLNTEAALANFRVVYDIPGDVMRVILLFSDALM